MLLTFGVLGNLKIPHSPQRLASPQEGGMGMEPVILSREDELQVIRGLGYRD